MDFNQFLTHFKGVKPTGPGRWKAKCPVLVHKDKDPSLSIRLNEDKILIHCHGDSGCSAEDIVKAAGLKMSDLFLKPKKTNSTITEVYDYRDEKGELLFQVCRKQPKGFTQRQPDGNGGWVYNLQHVRRVLYRLPELLNADPNELVWIPEGEKDVDKLASLDLVATCNPGGAGKWRKQYNEPLKGRHVVILPDNDESGRQHAQKVAEALQDIAASLKIIELPGLPYNGDVSNWLDAEHTVEELLDLVEQEEKGEDAVGEVMVGSLEDARAAVAKWLELPDLDVVDLILATVIANACPGDPVWLLLVGPPSSAKSELLRALGNAKQVYRLSSLTGKTLISGHKDAGGGLLFRVRDGSTLLLLDFGQVLSLHPNDKALVLQRLREMYDGYTKGDFGNRADSVEWRGKLGFLAGVTPAIEKYTSVGAELGDRFLLYEIRVPDPGGQALGAISKTGHEQAMRQDLEEAFTGALQTTSDPRNVTLSDKAAHVLKNLSVLTTRFRSVVSRDHYTRAIDYIPQPEGPARFAKALVTLGKALAVVRGHDTIGADELSTLAKVSLNCIPSRRRTLLKALVAIDQGTTKEIGLKANIATKSTALILEDLMYLGAVNRWADGEHETAAFHWSLESEVRKQWKLANDLAGRQELDTQKQTREIREIKKGSTHSPVFVYQGAGRSEEDFPPFTF